MSHLTLEHSHLEDFESLSQDEQRGAQLLQEIYDNWSYVTFNHEEVELHGPSSKKEVDFALERLHNFDQLALENAELLDWAGELRTVATESQKRRFIGSWWIIGGVSLFLMIAIYTMGISNMTYDMNLDQAKNGLQYEINYLQKDVNRLEAIPNRTEVQMGALENQKERLAELQQLTAEEYRELRVDQSFWRGFRFTMRQIPMILFVVAYYFASKAPEYLNNRRERELMLTMRGAGYLKKAVLGLMGFFLATPWVTIYDVHADGSKSFSDDNMTSGMLQLVWKFGMPLVVALFVMYTMIIILPFLTIINYLRNYQSALIDQYVDIIKGVFIKSKTA